jgi:hypothetical protein
MFAEKDVIYPHPSDIANFQQNAIITLIFKVAFKAQIKNVRLFKFLLQDYRQLMVDVEFCKFTIPRYVKDEFWHKPYLSPLSPLASPDFSESVSIGWIKLMMP